ncbi:MAG: alpha-glucan family phosphorylase, partial [Myxococcales bacterium]|nr:alpha-glucan family phosphorylase [Myxococcales bacterium]
NLWWYWDYEATRLLRRVDRDAWRETNHNPIAMLGRARQERLRELAEDDAYLAAMKRVHRRMQEYLSEKKWYQKAFAHAQDEFQIAYFSAEYGLAECLPIYSGGLGILSGDHLKSASELGLPFVGIGLIYHHGYFRQYLNADGWQQEENPKIDTAAVPFQPVLHPDGARLRFTIDVDAHPVVVQAWRVQVGRVPLYLMDTNLEGNRPEDRHLTSQLYGGDWETRIRQEIVLGMGGIELLAALGRKPTVYHMNEGHSAFLGLQRIRHLMQNDAVSFEEALEACSASNVFTTHTPVPAGNDEFQPDAVWRFFRGYCESVGISRDRFLALGRRDANNASENFSMTVLAIRLADHLNGVSRLHGAVSRRMWQTVWPQHPESDVPIHHVTNGVHHRTWIAPEMAALYDLYLGPGWIEAAWDPESWARVKQIPDAELWRTHERNRERLVTMVRQRMRRQLERRGASRQDIRVADEVLDPEALTIGFARRFATYKRGTLLFRDGERLARILNDAERPVQIIFAGKAHPRDNSGKEFIRQIVHFARDPQFRGHVVFIEDYDMNVARELVQGVDVWLNNPRRPLEASGTSGMKTTMNGGLNCSILDGWWVEGYSPETGWAIGSGEEYSDQNYQDEVESHSLYDRLEHEIVPTFYQRGRDGLPREWIAMMKAAIAAHGPMFNTNRMVMQYTNTFYAPAHERWTQMSRDAFRGARELCSWKERVRQSWEGVRIIGTDARIAPSSEVGKALPVEAEVHLGTLQPEDVRVQIYSGKLDPAGDLLEAKTYDMSCAKKLGEGNFIYRGDVPCGTSGTHGFAIRILPANKLMSNAFETSLMRWL